MFSLTSCSGSEEKNSLRKFLFWESLPIIKKAFLTPIIWFSGTKFYGEFYMVAMRQRQTTSRINKQTFMHHYILWVTFVNVSSGVGGVALTGIWGTDVRTDDESQNNARCHSLTFHYFSHINMQSEVNLTFNVSRVTIWTNFEKPRVLIAFYQVSKFQVLQIWRQRFLKVFAIYRYSSHLG